MFQFRDLKRALVPTVLIVIIFVLLKQARDEFERVETAVRSRAPVPNIVHFFLLGDSNKVDGQDGEISFIGATCILAAHFNQKPEEIRIHTNYPRLAGKYWTILKAVIGDSVLKIEPRARPTHVYGNLLSSTFHATDVARIQTLSKTGGIALDLDTFIVKSLDEFFHDEVTIGWPWEQNIGTQVSSRIPFCFPYFLNISIFSW